MDRCLPRWLAILAVVILVVTELVAQSQPPLKLITTSLPQAIAGNVVTLNLDTTGGTPPRAWSITGGALPLGVKLDAASGALSGTPTVPGTYTFQVLVVDSSVPTMQVQREFNLVVTGALGIEWKQ